VLGLALGISIFFYYLVSFVSLGDYSTFFTSTSGVSIFLDGKVASAGLLLVFLIDKSSVFISLTTGC
jgi:hypothetical protein